MSYSVEATFYDATRDGTKLVVSGGDGDSLAFSIQGYYTKFCLAEGDSADLAKFIALFGGEE